MNKNKIHSINIPGPVMVHDDIMAAVEAQDWIMLKEVVYFLKPLSWVNVLHWMIQEKDRVCANDVFRVLDDAADPTCCPLFPSSVTLLQRAVACNRIDVMRGLIERGHPLYQDFECDFLCHPLLLALHPSVEEDTFAALLSYYAFPAKNAFLKYMNENHLCFYVPISSTRMAALEEAGADLRACHADLLCGDAQALVVCHAPLSGADALAAYLLHYIALQQMDICTYLASQFIAPASNPTLALAVLRSNHAPLVKSMIHILSLAEPVVAEKKSAMLLAAECNADQSCAALMEANVDGEVELDGRSSFFQFSRSATAYLAAMMNNNQSLAKSLQEYNVSRKKKNLLSPV